MKLIENDTTEFKRENVMIFKELFHRLWQSELKGSVEKVMIRPVDAGYRTRYLTIMKHIIERSER